jgi:Tol biopolymer transport system component
MAAGISILFAGCQTTKEGVTQEEFSEWDPRSENVTSLQTVTSGNSINHHPQAAGGGQIIFSSDRDGVMDAWSKSITGGGGTRQLTDYSEPDVRPSPHPNGKEFTFISERGGEAGIFMGHFKKPTATSLTSVSEPPFSGFAAAKVSPDGSTVVYASGRHIWKYDLENSTKTQMVSGHQPSWHPNGEEIIFVRKAGEVGEGITTSIRIMKSDGTNLRQLLSSGKEDVYLRPGISPNGEQICYTRAPIENQSTGELGNKDIWISDINGSNQRRLTTNPFQDIEPTWISNTRVAFTSLRPETDKVEDATWNIWSLFIQ